MSDMDAFNTRMSHGWIRSVFAVALFAVSARIWLPGDMLAPAPIN